MVNKSIAAMEREKLLSLWKEEDACDLWEMTKQPCQFQVVDVKIGNEDMGNATVKKVRIEVLTENQLDDCKSAAMRSLEEQGVTNPTQDVQVNALIKQLLWFAVKNPNPNKHTGIYLPVFQTPEQVGQLPTSVLSTLFNLYQQTEYKFGAVERIIRNKDDLEAFITRLVEGGERDFLSVYSSHQLVEIIQVLAAEYYIHVQASKLPTFSGLNILNLLLGTGYSIELPADRSGDSIQSTEENPEPAQLPLNVIDTQVIESVKKKYSEPRPIKIQEPKKKI